MLTGKNLLLLCYGTELESISGDIYLSPERGKRNKKKEKDFSHFPE